MRSFLTIAALSILAAALTACGSLGPSQFTAADGPNTGPAFGNSPACIKRLPGDCKVR